MRRLQYRLRALLLLVLLAALGSAGAVWWRGASGPPVVIDAFDAVEMDGAGDLDLIVGDSAGDP